MCGAIVPIGVDYCPTCYQERNKPYTTMFDKLKLMTIDEFSDWLYEHGMVDGSPWMNWFDKTYCSKCESIKCSYTDAVEKLDLDPFDDRPIVCAYCEIEHKCKYFPDMEELPGMKYIIKLWLNSAEEDNNGK